MRSMRPPQQLAQLPVDEDSMELTEVFKLRTYKFLTKLNPSKACGPDEIPNQLLKGYAKILSFPRRWPPSLLFRHFCLWVISQVFRVVYYFLLPRSVFQAIFLTRLSKHSFCHRIIVRRLGSREKRRPQVSLAEETGKVYDERKSTSFVLWVRSRCQALFYRCIPCYR